MYIHEHKGEIMNELLTTRKAAEFLQCSERHVFNLIQRGDLKVFRDGIVRIYLTSLQEYLAKHTEQN